MLLVKKEEEEEKENLEDERQETDWKLRKEGRKDRGDS